MLRLVRLGALVAVVAAIAAPASAATLFLSDSARGWITAGAATNGTAATNNYLVGFCATTCANQNTEFRNWFQFSIPTLSDPVVAVHLIIDTGNVNTPDAFETYQLTSIPSSFVYSDLGTGTLYGSRDYTTGDAGSTGVDITLDAAAVAAIVSGTTFGIGGRITTLTSTPGTAELVFGFTGSLSNVQLEIITAPEPSAYGLVGAGLAGLWFIRRRRASQRSRPRHSLAAIIRRRKASISA